MLRMTVKVLGKYSNYLDCWNTGFETGDNTVLIRIGPWLTFNRPHHPKSIKVPRDIRHACNSLDRTRCILLYPIVKIDSSIARTQHSVSICLRQTTEWHGENKNRKNNLFHAHSPPYRITTARASALEFLGTTNHSHHL